jgi:hypothetical protein
MTRFSFQSLVLLTLLAVVVSPGCKPAVVEKSKPAAEKSFVGQELVYKDESGAEVRFAGGTAPVSLPLTFPSDVPLYPKAVPVQTRIKAPTVCVFLNTPDSAAKVKAFYEEKLKENGWKTKIAGTKTDALLDAVKEGRKLQVLIPEKEKNVQYSVTLAP